jgi:hypothetical protein
VDSVFAAEAAILVHFEFFGGVLLVLHGVVVSLLALVASEYDFDAHIGTSILLPPCFVLTDLARHNRLNFMGGYFCGHKNKPICRQVK